MCLMVYLGVDAPLPGFDPVGLGEVGLDPDPHQAVPAPLMAKTHVYRICDRVSTGWNCSCIFLDMAMPWEDPDAANDADAGKRRAAYARLRNIAAAAMTADPKALLFSHWEGDAEQRKTVERAVPPSALKPDRYLFDDVQDGGTGGSPPVLIRLVPEDAA